MNLSKRLDELDALLRITGARRPDPGPDSFLAQAVEGDRRHEDWMLKEFACGRILPGIFPIDHQGIGFTACPVVFQYIFFGDLERALTRATLPNGRLLPGLIGLPSDHEIAGEMPLFLGFDVPVQPARNGHGDVSSNQLYLSNVR